MGEDDLPSAALLVEKGRLVRAATRSLGRTSIQPTVLLSARWAIDGIGSALLQDGLQLQLGRVVGRI